ncbi:CopG family transcriptional regulator [Chroococcus sp. FPU101]|uniref:CopG family transcriptional regulator n=1 Tax=Chroococcus sp. FPU101 TaxID=1974212 RepID=UPI001A8C0C33|nr:CopG family transcriptional regulator [Chroococcus sp. FPU101]GFE71896.1 hypothetical protein CFPU101_45060 [Chroococcus sp. FPU101]
MTKKAPDKSRFDDLFSAALERGGINPLTETQPTQAQANRTSKSTDPNYVRTTLYLPKRLHQQLKAVAVQEEREMSGIVEELIDTWLKSRDSSI